MRHPVIPCCMHDDAQAEIQRMVERIRELAPGESSGPASWREGVFLAAIERIRGQTAASGSVKKKFAESALQRLKDNGRIEDWRFAGSGERHDYEIDLVGNKVIAIEAKGCLDGNNTNIFRRPPRAEEFYIWSLCQNVGADPRHNVWSGIHTRLGAQVIDGADQIDGLIVWDMLCGTPGRPCPKRGGIDGTSSAISPPPPCIYLFPRTRPDPRNNPSPPPANLGDLKFLQALFDEYTCSEEDLNEVWIEARMDGFELQRRTTIKRLGQVVAESRWTTLKRAKAR